MSAAPLPPDWLAALHAGADQPPRRPRVPLRWRDAVLGSVDPELPAQVDATGVAALPWAVAAGGVDVSGDLPLTSALARLAQALQAAGLVHAWRGELLAVQDEAGRRVGEVERGAVRLLGIPTHAVHLLGHAPDGRHWVQQRSLDKANDPGLWDTLMGGMVPAGDDLRAALARETWEEAGLRLEQLRDLAPGGRFVTRRPSEEPMGYVVEAIDWFRAVVPDGVAPANQDGEVAQFRLLAPAEVREWLLAGRFTTEAALAFAAAGLNPR